MAIGTPVQIGTAADGTSSPWSITTSGAAPSGSTVILLVTLWQNSTAGTMSITTAGGLTWAKDYETNENDGTGPRIFAAFSAPAPSGLASSTVLGITMTGGGSTFGAGITALYVDGLASPPVLEDSDFDWADPGSTADWWGGAGARNVTVAGEALLLAQSMGDGGAATSVTDAPGTELSDFTDGTNGWNHSAAYRVVSTGGNYTLDGNFSTGQTFGVLTGLVAYSGAAPAEWPPPGSENAPETYRVLTGGRF